MPKTQIKVIDYRRLREGTAWALTEIERPSQAELADALSVRMSAKLDTTPGMEERVATILNEFLLKNPEYIEMLEPLLED